MDNEFGGGMFTFTSSEELTESAGAFGDSTEFGVSVLNTLQIILYVYGGKDVNSGRELHLENKVFPV